MKRRWSLRVLGRGCEEVTRIATARRRRRDLPLERRTNWHDARLAPSAEYGAVVFSQNAKRQEVEMKTIVSSTRTLDEESSSSFTPGFRRFPMRTRWS
jgi:hypothetical protein